MQYRFYHGSSATIWTSAVPQSILCPQLCKTPYCPDERFIMIYYYMAIELSER